MTTIVRTQGAANACPDSHPYQIPGSNCCAEGRDLFYYKQRQRGMKHMTYLPDQQGNRKRNKDGNAMEEEEYNQDDDDDDDDEDVEMNFGRRKPRKFKQFRAAYKRTHPRSSEHRILVKYTAALLRLRNNNY